VRDPGAVLLIACYELGHQPLAVAWPAAVLEQRGFAPAVLDISVEPLDAEKVRRARLVAISVPMHTALRVGITVAERVRRLNPGAHVCFYGLYATLNAEHLLAQGADSVIGGEVEEPLAALVEALESGRPGPLPGVRRRSQPAGPHIARPALPRPSRAALPALKTYARLERDGSQIPVGYVEASRGCKHLCRHCPIPPVYGGRFFVVPADVVLEDVAQQVEAGAGHITFGDPDFLNGPGHALEVARRLHHDFPSVTFDFTAKVEHLLRRAGDLPELGALGCLFVVSAVESLSETVLGHLDKGHTRADVEVALAATRAAGIALRPTWVAFTPWTTLRDFVEMLDWIAARDLVDHVDPVQYSLRLLVPPGSLLVDHPGMRPYLGALVAADFSYEWRHPDPRMEALQADVAALIAESAPRAEDPAVTFDRVRALAATAAATPAPAPLAPRLAPDRRRPPRLTEPWFC
jgi:radical SAM superfamily enzyme YgiQ (UPF0313 family)